jgi:hypothetical protein
MAHMHAVTTEAVNIRAGTENPLGVVTPLTFITAHGRPPAIRYTTRLASREAIGGRVRSAVAEGTGGIHAEALGRMARVRPG